MKTFKNRFRPYSLNEELSSTLIITKIPVTMLLQQKFIYLGRMRDSSEATRMRIFTREKNLVK